MSASKTQQKVDTLQNLISQVTIIEGYLSSLVVDYLGSELYLRDARMSAEQLRDSIEAHLEEYSVPI